MRMRILRRIGFFFWGIRELVAFSLEILLIVWGCQIILRTPYVLAGIGVAIVGITILPLMKRWLLCRQRNYHAKLVSCIPSDADKKRWLDQLTQEYKSIIGTAAIGAESFPGILLLYAVATNWVLLRFLSLQDIGGSGLYPWNVMIFYSINVVLMAVVIATATTGISDKYAKRTGQSKLKTQEFALAEYIAIAILVAVYNVK